MFGTVDEDIKEQYTGIEFTLRGVRITELPDEDQDRNYNEGIEDTVLCERECPYCNRTQAFVLDSLAVGMISVGHVINDVPIPAHAREMFITGICDDCWNEMFGEPE
jgi:hypothetical protein